MSFNQKEIIDRIMDGKTNGTASNMFIKGDVMYSYGRHFPLLVRTPWGNVLNADKYSVTTSQHQSLCSKAATMQIPFSALSEAMRSTDGYSSMSFKLADATVEEVHSFLLDAISKYGEGENSR